MSPCIHVDLGNGQRAICKVGRGPTKKCKFCKANSGRKVDAPFLCDFVTGPAPDQTCDAPCCAKHCTEVGPDQHHCVLHLHSADRAAVQERLL